MEDDDVWEEASSTDAGAVFFTCQNCGLVQKTETSHESHLQEKIKYIKEELKQDESDDSDAGSQVSVSLNPIEELPLINSPFQKSEEKSGIKWQAPKSTNADRSSQFKWEKPWGGDDTESETPAQRIRRLEQTIDEKKEDLDILGKQYSKAQAENYSLAEEIHSFKGEHYDDLKAENKKLKSENHRLFKENMMLRSQMKRLTNSKIAEIKEKETLEELYGVKQRKNSKASSAKK